LSVSVIIGLAAGLNLYSFEYLKTKGFITCNQKSRKEGC
jgi:hypothetical protein